jgi:signal transduction histidine kinase
MGQSGEQYASREVQQIKVQEAGTAPVVAGIVAGGLAGLLGTVDLREAALLAAVFEPLGIMTACALLLSVREFPVVVANLRPAFGIVALALILLGLFWLLLGAAGEQASRSGIALALSVPFCLWVAMQRRSLDGAALSFVAAHLVLLFMLHACGTIDHAEFVNTIIYLDLLVATCQLVHAVNIDRVRAFAEIEAHKRDLEARVAERTAKLSEMTERALAADAAKSKFVATVSHEIRNPLNGVIGMASLVLAGDLDERARRNVEVIRTSGLHLLDVVNRILDFSRLGHEPAAEELVTFDLSELFGEVLGEAAASPHAQGLALREEIDSGLATRRVGSRQGLRQVLTNLVGNATKFTDAGSVTLRAVDRPDGIVRIEVEDTGIGIPDEMREKVFRPFEQVGASQARRPGGTGLGLAICAETVERMGGRIGLGSAAGGGSLFWVELPLARAGAALHSIGQQAAASA